MSEQWKNLCGEFSAHNKHLIEQVEKKNKEISRYKQALEFYADEDKWKPTITYTPEGDIHEGPPRFIEDDGEKAREALRGELE